jgi:hypothetical protein
MTGRDQEYIKRRMLAEFDYLGPIFAFLKIFSPKQLAQKSLLNSAKNGS